jgi:hypothetical protein
MRRSSSARVSPVLGLLGGISGVLFGLFWTFMAFSITRDAPEPFSTLLPLFGVLIVVIGAVNAAYNLYKLTREKRLSVFDIEASPEASDLLHGLQERETSPDTVEGNLEALKSLREKGLVTEVEYAAQRQRILNTL